MIYRNTNKSVIAKSNHIKLEIKNPTSREIIWKRMMTSFHHGQARIPAQ